MKKTLVITYGIPLLVVASSIAIALSPLLQKHPEIAMGITYDLVLLAPILFLLLAHKNNVGTMRALPFFVGGLAIASIVLPQNNHTHLNIIKTFLLPAVELSVLAWVAYKVFLALKLLRKNSETIHDFLQVSKKTCRELFGSTKIAALVSSELGMLYYAFFSWQKKKPAANTFTNYKENATMALAMALLMVVLIETFAFHALLSRWSVVAAWMLTATSIYTAITIVSHIKALGARPSILTKNKLILRNGIIADLEIDLEDIEKIEERITPIKDTGLKVGNLGLAKESLNHNIAIYFKTPQTIEKMYGFTKKCDILFTHIDHRNDFLKKGNERLEKNGS